MSVGSSGVQRAASSDEISGETGSAFGEILDDPCARLHHWSVKTLVFAALLIGSTANAQMIEVPPSSRVRVFAPHISKEPLVGKLAFGIIDTVNLDVSVPPERRTVPVTSVQRLDISRGLSRRAGAARGVRYGVITALVFTAVVVGADGANGGDATNQGMPKSVVYGLSALGGGTLLGALLGSRYPAEDWRTVYPKRTPRATSSY